MIFYFVDHHVTIFNVDVNCVKIVRWRRVSLSHWWLWANKCWWWWWWWWWLAYERLSLSNSCASCFHHHRHPFITRKAAQSIKI